MQANRQTTCPGCGLQSAEALSAVYHGYYHTSPQCWLVYTEVLGTEFSNAVLFGQVHQLTVDAYAAQHAGGPHPDKSVAIHLAGLHLVLDHRIRPVDVPKRLQHLARSVETWPTFKPPAQTGPLTVAEVAQVESPQQHAAAVRRWSRQVWNAWSDCHAEVAGLVANHQAVW